MPSALSHHVVVPYVGVNPALVNISVTLILTSAGFTPTYATTTWWDNADGTTVPTLQTTDKIKFEKVGAVLYGSHIGSIL